jgi:hypothetical protein
MRALVRQRQVLLTEQASWVQRMQKALLQMNLQLTEVLSDIMDMTGQGRRSSAQSWGGECDPKVLARHRHGRVKRSEDDIVRALTGNWREGQLFVLEQSLTMYDDTARHLGECDAKLQALLDQRRRHQPDLGPAPRSGSRQRMEFDLQQRLANCTGVDLTGINGMGVGTVMTLLSEIGPDLSRFANVKHFCSWLGLCTGTKISGGKGPGFQYETLGQPRPPGIENGCHGPVTQRLCARRVLSPPVRPHEKAARQYHSGPEARALVYFMLARGETFVDQRQQRYEEQQQQRSVAALKRRAATLGFRLEPVMEAA